MKALQYALFDTIDRIGSFIDAGGFVLVVIAGVIFVMWALTIERYLFIRYELPRQEARIRAWWEERHDRRSWSAKQLRQAVLAGVKQNAYNYLGIIRTLVGACPLFGLLGTVTGMIAVFDVMASSGMGNPRLMASGVSQATIPTMAGMVGALSGIFAIHWLEQKVKTRLELLDDHLTLDH